jgi:hypothetical protein
MAIEKGDAHVRSIKYLPDIEGVLQVVAIVDYELTDGSTSITRVVEEITVTNATSAEKTAVASVISKGAVLAVA